MSQLNNNTTALQTLLEIANALPEAGGGLKYATGTIKVYAASKTATISGLDFEPKVVAAFYNQSLMFASSDVSGKAITGSNVYTTSLTYANGVCTLTTSGNWFYGVSNGYTYTWWAWGI